MDGSIRSPRAIAAEQERDQLLDALRKSRGDVRAAARALGWPERTTWRRITTHALDAELRAIRAA